MSDVVPPDAEVPRFGELLVRAGIVASADVVEALQVSRRIGVPVGRVLIAAECISERMVDAVLQAQKLLKKETNSDSAVEALKLVAKKRISFKDARIEHQREQATLSRSLAQLIVDAEIASLESVKAAAREAYASRDAFFEALARTGAITPALIPLLLQAEQKLLNAEHQFSDVVAEVRSAYGLWLKVGQIKQSSVEAP
jgi:hypothetical protein